MILADELNQMVHEFGMGPTLPEMPKLTLKDKWINGPTAAHKIEEVHTPKNLAYITCTTGTSAFQNLVGVTYPEIPGRAAAGTLALQKAGVHKRDKILCSYPPLINVFHKDALKAYSTPPLFIERPSRDALLAALISQRPQVVLGESSFLLAAIRDAYEMGLLEQLPENLILIAAGTPFAEELKSAVDMIPRASVHDMYGCQEYGCLALDGELLRSDITLLADQEKPDRFHLLVGGIPTGDTFLLGAHFLNPAGKLLTYTCKRAETEPDCCLLETPVRARETALRTARTVLRLKGHVVRVSRELKCGAEATLLRVRTSEKDGGTLIRGPESTRFWDEMTEAQKELQGMSKTDPVWSKREEHDTDV